MTASTTLMTFLVRVPPTTRSVTLLGSWDNFSKPYTMRRDIRIGPEHWSGCHSFQNIIYDGIGNSGKIARDGGLKMGGTYWYYYKLDDDLEFHNSAEPSTTSCPLLPGQLVNVLNVPFNLASGRPRNASTSSAVSEFRSMNPDDKFLNPRPVPQPKLLRLNTSPTLPTFPLPTSSPPSIGPPWSAKRNPSSRDVSPPSSESSLKLFRTPRKMSAGQSRSTSPGRDRVAGIKATLRAFRSPRSSSPEAEISRGRPVELNLGTEISQPMLVHRPAIEELSRPETRTGNPALHSSRSAMSPIESETRPPRPNLALRRGVDQPSEIEQGFSNPSFQHQRRQRSQSRDPSPLRTSMSLSEDLELREAIAELSIGRNGALETVREANSNLNTPQWPLTAIKIPKNEGLQQIDSTSGQNGKKTPMDASYLEKRLPTLPNTPSSAYPPSASDYSPSKRLSTQIKKMEEDIQTSHFSGSTTSNTSTTDSIQLVERSHFSAWTSSTISSSPTSQFFSQVYAKMDTPPLPPIPSSLPTQSFPPRGESLLPGIHERTLSGSLKYSDTMPSTTSFSTLASSASTSPLSEMFEDLDSRMAGENHQTKTPKGDYDEHVQTYQLPRDESIHVLAASKPMFQDFVNHINTTKRQQTGELPEMEQIEPIHTVGQNQLLPHSESMQQLIDELSYLRTLIEG